MLTRELALRAALAPILAARAGGYGLAVEQRSGAEGEWLPAAELARDDGPLDELVAAVARGAGLEHPTLGAEWVAEHHAWQGTSLVAAAMMSGRWVPDLRPGNVLCSSATGRSGASRFAAARSAGSMTMPRSPAPATTR